MQIPQEIVDAVIDNFATFGDDDEPFRVESDTLEACALVSRSFLPRSQRHLFALLTCHERNVLKLERLLVESPHIGIYARCFSLFLPGNESPALYDSFVPPSHFMPLLSHLEYLKVFARKSRPWESQPLFLKSALQAAFPLSSLRSIHLARYSFTNVGALDTLLSHTIGLKELSLDAIDFDTYARPASVGPRHTSIMIDSLRMTYTKSAVSNAIAYGFQMVNITQLRSLDLRMTWMVIQELRLCQPPCAFESSASLLPPVNLNSIVEPLSYDLLEGNTNLHSLDIVQSSTGIVSSLCIGGNLRHLKALKTTSLCILELELILDVEWPEIDAILAQASDSLAEVHLCTDASTIELYFDLAQRLLPSVATKIGLGDDSS